MQFSYWPIISGATGFPAGEPSPGPLALGLALVPFVFLVVAFASRHPRAAGAVLKAMGLFLVIGLPLGVVEPLFGIPAGFAAGGIVALRPSEELRGVTRARAIAVGAGLAYLFVMGILSPGFAAYVGAVLPFAVLGLSDQAQEWRASMLGPPA